MAVVLLYMYINHVLFLKSPEMAGQHNDSSQMKAILQPGEQNNTKPKKEEENNYNCKHNKEDDSKYSSSSQASCSHTCSNSSSCGASCTADVRRKQAERNDLWREEVIPSSCCFLQDLKRPECDIKLGELHHSRTHTVLINVRLSPFHLLFVYNKVHLPKDCIEVQCEATCIPIL